MEGKDIQELVDAGFKGIEGKFDGKVEEVKNAVVKSIEEKGYQSAEQVTEAVKKATGDLEKEILEIKKAQIEVKASQSQKNFKSILGESLKGKENELKALKNGTKTSFNAMLTKANEDLDPANFTNDALEIATRETRGLYESPFSPVWFRNLMPQGTTSGGTIQYLKENGDVSAAGVWDGTGAIAALTEKPGTAPLFDGVTETVTWIAGITRVKREMLDDIPWLQGYLSRKLTTGRTGLWVAENTQIYTKLTANSVAYDGTKTNPVEIVYDAAFGQLRDNYYNPTTILLNSRDVVNLMVLNQAAGSGEFDLPPNTVAMVGGQLTIGGVPVIGAPNVPQGEFLIFDRNATEFISRMSPEVRFFEEDRDNVPKNLVTVRAEERILPIVYDDNAVVYGSFSTT